MADPRTELLLRRFYLTLEVMCTDAQRTVELDARLRIGDLYDDYDEAPSLWERGATRPFLFGVSS